MKPTFIKITDLSNTIFHINTNQIVYINTYTNENVVYLSSGIGVKTKDDVLKMLQDI